MYCNGLLVSSNTTRKIIWDAYDQYHQYDERTLRYLSCSRDLDILSQITQIPEDDSSNINFNTYRRNIVVYFHNIIQKQAAYGLLSHSLPNIINILRSMRIR